MIVATTARCLHESDPSIWRGRLADGSQYEAHYRWGWLQIWRGETAREVFGGDLIFAARLTWTAQPGICYDDLVAITKGDVAWPEHEDQAGTLREPPRRKPRTQ